MSIKRNEFGEVISVNGITTGHHIGKPMQDAVPDRPEDNENYATELAVVTRNSNVKEDEQPKPTGGGDKTYYIFIDEVAKTVTATEGIYDAIIGLLNNSVPINIIVFQKFAHCTVEHYPNRYEFDPDNPGEQLVLTTGSHSGTGPNCYIRKDGNHWRYDD